MCAVRQHVRLLAARVERGRGLLGTHPDAVAVMLVRCASVHTIGMRYPIDVAFVSASGTVLRVVIGLPPGRIASCRGARYAIERPHGDGSWFTRGMRLAFEAVGTDDGEGKC